MLRLLYTPLRLPSLQSIARQRVRHMANSKFAYVRKYELPDQLLPGTYVVFRLDGHNFHRFSEEHGFVKPNDEHALQLMDRAACEVMSSPEYKGEIILGFGQSDEFSFLFRKDTTLYNRRQAKIVSTLTSLFTASYIFHWSTYFPNTPLRYPPSFDGRVVLYPGKREVHDYFAWRQADTHINNLYNTAFWALVQQGGETTAQAHATLRGTVSSQKHEILFSRFNINYNDINPRFRKGSVIMREQVPKDAHPHDSFSLSIGSPLSHEVKDPLRSTGGESPSDSSNSRKKIVPKLAVFHCDIISDQLWPALLQ